jgi:hypothetical protein
MLYVVYDTNDKTVWYPNYLSGLKKALDHASIEHQFRTTLPEGVSDPVLLTRYTLADLLLNSDFPPKQCFLQEHEVWNPFTNGYDERAMVLYHHPSLRGILVNHPTMVPWVERWLPTGSKAKAVAVGFPYDDSHLDLARESIPALHDRPNLVVFPGRIDECYQPYLAVRLSLELLQKGYQVIFASPAEPPSYYPISVWRQMGIEVGQFSQADYYTILRRARAAISCTIGGNLTLALYEAYLLGAPPIIAQGRPELPPFTSMYRPGFDVLNPLQAIMMVEQNTRVVVDLTWFSPTDYVTRLLAAMNNLL